MCIRRELVSVMIIIGLALMAGCRTAEPTATDAPPIATETPAPTVAPTPPETTATSETPPDAYGGVIAFYSERDGNAEIYIMNADGSAETRLTHNRALDIVPDLSPDGSQIVFVSNRDGNEEIYRMNRDGSDVVRLTNTPAQESYPYWSPDGTKILFCSKRDDGRTYEVYLMNSDGTDQTRITNNSVSEEWAYLSPDMQKIVYAVGPFPRYGLYVMNVDGSDQHQVFSSDKSAGCPKWSRDGRTIVFNHAIFSSGNIIGDICLINEDGTNLRQITTTGGNLVSEGPFWSPDGSRIVFQSNRTGNFQIYVMNADGSNQVRLTNHHGNDYWPTWGPAATEESGSSLSFEKSEQTFASVPTYQIGLADLDGDGDLDAVFSNGQANDSQVWLNDGGGFFTDSGQQLGEYGHGVNVGDLDGDGDPDLLINTHQDFAPSRVYLNDGHAIFQELEGAFEVNIGFNVHLFDLDGDGDLDAVGEAAYAANVYLNDGTGAFSANEMTFPLTTVWGDLDGDGDVDVLVKENRVGYAVHLNDGMGHFDQHWNHADDAAMDPGDMALGDVDNDGDLDAVITNGHFQSTSHPGMVFINDGTGRFADSGQRLSAVKNAGVSLGDLDADGDPDLVLADYMEACQIWLNDGSGQFADSGFRFGDDQFYRHVHLGDLDGDGDLDIFLATFGMGKGPNEIWFNTTAAGESARPEGNGLYLGQKPPGLDMEVFAPGIVSIEEGKEYKITISPDLQEIFFTRRTPGARNDRLWYSRFENGKLTTPELVPFAYDALETDACFTPDGNRLYFNSARPLPGEEAASARPNVWFVDRTETGWSEPQFLGPPLNDYQPVYFSFANDGTLYFTRSSPRGIYYAEPEDGQYREAQRLPDEINYVREAAHPAVAPDESYIIVDSAYEQGGRLVGSLYISFKRPDGSWTNAVSIHDTLRAAEADVYASPRITPDGKYLFFEDYEKETDKSDLYWVSTEVLEEIRSKILE